MKFLEGRTGFILKSAVSLGLIGLLIWHIDLDTAWGKIKDMPPEWLVAALTLMLMQAFAAAARWTQISTTTGLPLGFPTALRIMFIGMFFNQTLPSSVGGDVVRIVMIQRRGVSLGTAFSNVLMDRIFGFFGLIAIAAAGFPTVSALLDSHASWGVLSVVGIGFAAVAVFPILGGQLGIYLTKFRFLAPFHRTGAGMRRVLASPMPALIVIGCSLTTHALMIVMFWVLAQGLAIDVSFGVIAALIPLSVVATMLPISVAGWGVREGAIVVLLGLVGVAAADALVLSLLGGLMMTAIGLPGGLLWLANRKAPIVDQPLQAEPLPAAMCIDR